MSSNCLNSSHISSIGLPEAAWFLSNVSKIYSPELTVGVTPVRIMIRRCDIDHVSYYRCAVVTISLFTRKGTQQLMCTSVLDESLIPCTITRVGASLIFFVGNDLTMIQTRGLERTRRLPSTASQIDCQSHGGFYYFTRVSQWSTDFVSFVFSLQACSRLLVLLSRRRMNEGRIIIFIWGPGGFGQPNAWFRCLVVHISSMYTDDLQRTSETKYQSEKT